MAVFKAGDVIAAFSANGDVHGVATFANVTGFQVGAKCYLRDTTGLNMVVRIINVDVTNKKLTLRLTNDADTIIPVGYAATDISAFTLANGSTLSQNRQDVFIDDVPYMNTGTAPTFL